VLVAEHQRSNPSYLNSRFTLQVDRSRSSRPKIFQVDRVVMRSTSRRSRPSRPPMAQVDRGRSTRSTSGYTSRSNHKCWCSWRFLEHLIQKLFEFGIAELNKLTFGVDVLGMCVDCIMF